MKKILLIICIIILMSFLTNVKQVNSEEINIPKEAIRIRVIANSNEEMDQKIKMKLSIELQKEITKLLEDTPNVEEARKIIKSNINLLNQKTKEFLNQENYDIEFTITYGNAFFPEKKYNDVIYEQGYYESLLVTLGNGEGNNWWCVLFPPLCLMEANENETGKVEYKFFIKELLDKYL
ncbi:MAG: hypothetical protein E7157_00495 [Lactobacillales bacterium]|nr:hypothetical protein [Lactobacillales bacterium]